MLPFRYTMHLIERSFHSGRSNTSLFRLDIYWARESRKGAAIVSRNENLKISKISLMLGDDRYDHRLGCREPLPWKGGKGKALCLSSPCMQEEVRKLHESVTSVESYQGLAFQSKTLTIRVEKRNIFHPWSPWREKLFDPTSYDTLTMLRRTCYVNMLLMVYALNTWT